MIGLIKTDQEPPQMTILQIASLLIVLAGAFGAINYLFLRLPPSIGILIVALLASFTVLTFDYVFSNFGDAGAVRSTVLEI